MEIPVSVFVAMIVFTYVMAFITGYRIGKYPKNYSQQKKDTFIGSNGTVFYLDDEDSNCEFAMR